MLDLSQRCFPASDRSYGAALKRDIHQLALGLSFSPRRLGELDIVVAELVSNLVKHAYQGELLVRPVSEQWGEGQARIGLELIAIDRGPGMANPGRMLEDGVSTTQTLGQGLGAINRLSDVFQLYSVVNWGTILLSRIFAESRSFAPSPTSQIGVVVLPKPGQTACGDGYAVVETSTHVKLFLGDGLGHGPLAEMATQRAISAFRRSDAVSPAALLTQIDEAIKGTRGLVGTVVIYDREGKNWQVCGVGNIATRISTAMTSVGYGPHNGIIGGNMPTRLIEQTMAVEVGQQVILYSDGLNNRWDVTGYAGLFKYDPSVLAAALYKDQARQTDDLSVIVGRIYA